MNVVLPIGFFLSSGLEFWGPLCFVTRWLSLNPGLPAAVTEQRESEWGGPWRSLQLVMDRPGKTVDNFQPHSVSQKLAVESHLDAKYLGKGSLSGAEEEN